jgi:hypothetical protein
LSVKILTLGLITIAFVINAYAIAEVIMAGIAYQTNPDTDAVGSFWRWGLLYSIVPEAITVIGLGLALRLAVRAFKQ